MVEVDPSQVVYLRQRLLDCSVDEFPVIRNFLKPHQADLVADLWQTLRDTEQTARSRFFAGMALAEYAAKSKAWRGADAELLAEHLLISNPDNQRALRSYLAGISTHLLPNLKTHFREGATDRVREAAANALADFAAEDAALLATLTSEATVPQYRILFPKLTADGADRDRVKERLMSLTQEQPDPDFSEAARVILGKRRAGAVITLIRLGHGESALNVFRVDDDPESLTQFVHRHKSRAVTPSQLIECLDHATEKVEERARFALLLALGEFELADLPGPAGKSLGKKLLDWYRNDPSSAIHGASGWLLRRWKFNDQVARVDQTPIPYDETGKREWFVRQVGEDYITLVVFRPGEFIMGSPHSEVDRHTDETPHMVRLTRTLAVADREVVRGQFDRFLAAKDYRFVKMDESSRTNAHVLAGTDWYDAVAYCRWFTEQAGMTEADQCYADDGQIPEDQKESIPNGRRVPRNWPFHPERQGFRLPTEAEWEYVCRSGMRSVYGFGSDREILDQYGWYVNNAGKKPHVPSALRPNLRGLFDMHGNVSEWCHDWSSARLADGEEDPTGPQTGQSRLLRGGGWNSHTRNCRSAYRTYYQPSYGNTNFGFRLVLSIGNHE